MNPPPIKWKNLQKKYLLSLFTTDNTPENVIFSIKHRQKKLNVLKNIYNSKVY